MTVPPAMGAGNMRNSAPTAQLLTGSSIQIKANTSCPRLYSPCASSGMASSAILLVREPARFALRGEGVATGLRAAEALAALLACEILHMREAPLSKVPGCADAAVIRAPLKDAVTSQRSQASTWLLFATSRRLHCRQVANLLATWLPACCWAVSLGSLGGSGRLCMARDARPSSQLPSEEAACR